MGAIGFSTTASAPYVHDVMPTLPHLTGLNCPGAQMMGVLQPSAVAIRTAQTGANGHGLALEETHTLDLANGQAVTILGKHHTHALTNSQKGATEDGTGRGTPVVLTFDARGNGDGSTINTLAGDHSNRVTDYTPLVQQACHAVTGEDEVPTLRGFGHGWQGQQNETHSVVQQPLAFKVRGGVERDSGGRVAGKGFLGNTQEAFTLGVSQDQFVASPVQVLASGQANAERLVEEAPTLNCNHDGAPNDGGTAGPLPYHPRRLLPIECERLMSWEDGHTAIGIDEQGREYALSDTARYRLCGNGVASVVAAWIGLRVRAALEGTL